MRTEGRATIGVTGLATMGRNLARNLARNGYTVALHNRTQSRVDALVSDFGHEGDFVPSSSLEEFVASLERPRAIIILVKAGAPTDAVIDELVPLLEEGDIVIDAGNAHFADTARREKALRERGLNFVGTGVSGGEEGALNGPSIMPGGSKASYEKLGPIFERISAHVDGEPCCMHVGPGAAGHFVKMVHNGIEYADMQLIAEAYDLMREIAGASPEQLAGIFGEWNKGELESFLIELTMQVLAHRDAETGKPFVDIVRGSGRAEGHGSLDGAERAGSGRPRHRHRRGDICPLAVRACRAEIDRPRHLRRRGQSSARRRHRVHRGCAQGALRLEDRRLRTGIRPDQIGLRGERLGDRPRAGRDDLARGMHHPGAVPEPDPRGL